MPADWIVVTPFDAAHRADFVPLVTIYSENPVSTIGEEVLTGYSHTSCNAEHNNETSRPLVHVIRPEPFYPAMG